MRNPKTNIPGLIRKTLPGGNMVVFMPADIDRQFGRYNLPDHGNLLGNIISRILKGNIPITIEGPGLIDCHIYRQEGRIIIHLVNLTNAATWRQPVDELIPVGPLKLKVKVPEGVNGSNVQLLVAGRKISAKSDEGWSRFEIDSVSDHEVAVVS
jgi:hypothetical protein